MRLRFALYALMLALPGLYLAGAYLQSSAAATAGLLLIAALCVYLIAPERKS
ncbi:MAG: hypothetical protein M3P51_09170 [Chloroflexota bacterium]|nr:hypothetical protein [Chloroflexota bacterium]